MIPRTIETPLREAIERQQISKNQHPFHVQYLGSNKFIMGNITFLLSSYTSYIYISIEGTWIQQTSILRSFLVSSVTDVPFCRYRQQQGWTCILQQEVQTHMQTHMHTTHMQKNNQVKYWTTATHINTNSSHKTYKNLSSTAQICLSSPADRGWRSPAGECIPFLSQSTVTFISSGLLNTSKVHVNTLFLMFY